MEKKRGLTELLEDFWIFGPQDRGSGPPVKNGETPRGVSGTPPSVPEETGGGDKSTFRTTFP